MNVALNLTIFNIKNWLILVHCQLELSSLLALGVPLIVDGSICFLLTLYCVLWIM